MKTTDILEMSRKIGEDYWRKQTKHQMTKEEKCPHLNCLVYHHNGVCNCNMRAYCPQCKGEESEFKNYASDINVTPTPTKPNPKSPSKCECSCHYQVEYPSLGIHRGHCIKCLNLYPSRMERG